MAGLTESFVFLLQSSYYFFLDKLLRQLKKTQSIYFEYELYELKCEGKFFWWGFKSKIYNSEILKAFWGKWQEEIQ